MNTKKIIITITFALLMLGLKAQEKYEYATVVYKVTGKSNVMIETSIGDKYSETQVPYSPSKILTVMDDLTPVITFLNKMGNEGWEVFNTTVTILGSLSIPTYHFFLRKKK